MSERIDLTQPERDLIKRRPSKTGVVGVVHFAGPRGRRYRPTRTKAAINEELAFRAAERIAERPYAHGAYPTKIELVTVDFIGRVQAREELQS